MGHSSEEKIKILYEDSLNDIRDLTNRMESMSSAVVSAAEKVAQGKTDLVRQREQLMNDVDTIKEAVVKIACKNGVGKAEVSAAVHEILLGEDGPMKDLRTISSRFFSTEANATKWLVRATNRMDQFVWYLFGAAMVGGVAGGVAGGIVIKLLLH